MRLAVKAPNSLAHLRQIPCKVTGKSCGAESTGCAPRRHTGDAELTTSSRIIRQVLRPIHAPIGTLLVLSEHTIVCDVAHYARARDHIRTGVAAAAIPHRARPNGVRVKSQLFRDPPTVQYVNSGRAESSRGLSSTARPDSRRDDSQGRLIVFRSFPATSVPRFMLETACRRLPFRS